MSPEGHILNEWVNKSSLKASQNSSLFRVKFELKLLYLQISSFTNVSVIRRLSLDSDDTWVFEV